MTNLNQQIRNLKLIIAYEGTRYAGFQRQTSEVLTIQGELEQTLNKLTRETITTHAAGRTDAGVHASGQVVNFHTETQMSLAKFQQALNALLPEDIIVKEISEVPISFHARYSAQAKTYSYHLVHGSLRPLFKRNFAYYYRYPLDAGLMRQAAELIIGTKDFRAFQAAGSSVKTSVRTVNFCELNEQENELTFRINANGFLYHMVRNIVGTLILVGNHRLDLAEFERIIAAKDRRAAGPTAPAKGLCLEEVYY